MRSSHSRGSVLDEKLPAALWMCHATWSVKHSSWQICSKCSWDMYNRGHKRCACHNHMESVSMEEWDLIRPCWARPLLMNVLSSSIFKFESSWVSCWHFQAIVCLTVSNMLFLNCSGTQYNRHLKEQIKQMTFLWTHTWILRGSGGLLGPSWTFPDTFWTIQTTIKIWTSVAPKDFPRPPRHIPDDPKNFKHISKKCQLFGKNWIGRPWTWPLGYGALC